MPRRVLVIGGASLVGSHLCDRLLADGDEVVAIDDLSRGTYANIAHLKNESRFAFVEHDVSQPFKAHVDEVFHLALPSTKETIASDPVHAAVTSVMGTVHALEVAREHRARVVLATSPERWGDAIRCAESLAIEYVRRSKLDVRIVRIPSPYGPRTAVDDASVVSRLVVACLRGAALDAVDDDDLLHLTYVDDAIETLLRMMRSDVRIPCVVAPYTEATLGGLVRAIAAAMRKAREVSDGRTEDSFPPPLPPPSREAVLAFTAAIARPTISDALPASLAFGLSPAVDLDEAIRRTVTWFAERVRSLRPNDARSGIFERRTGGAKTSSGAA